MGFRQLTSFSYNYNCYTHTGYCWDYQSCCYSSCRSNFAYTGTWTDDGNGNYYYYYSYTYWACDNSKTLYVYEPCDPYCSTCTVGWSSTNCQSCHHNFSQAYHLLNWGDTSYQECRLSCPDRMYDNLYKGQYIRSTSDLTCSWCNASCSSCDDFSNGLTCHTCITTYYLLANKQKCLDTFPDATDRLSCQ